MKLQEVIDLQDLSENRGIRFIVKKEIYEITGEAADKKGVLVTNVRTGKDILVDIHSFAALATYCEVYQKEVAS